MAKDILCAFGVDVDAVARWLGSYGGEDSPDDISRGLFAGEMGAPRLLKLFERYGLRIHPGSSLATRWKPSRADEGRGRRWSRNRRAWRTATKTRLR